MEYNGLVFLLGLLYLLCSTPSSARAVCGPCCLSSQDADLQGKCPLSRLECLVSRWYASRSPVRCIIPRL